MNAMKYFTLFFIWLVFLCSLFSPKASAFTPSADLEQTIASYSFKIVFSGSLILALLAAVALRLKKPTAFAKKLLFLAMVAAIIIPTFFLAISTIYLNTISSSRGPVHWHADIEIWNCGTEVDLENPTGWSNKVGTASLHEHNDKRIHLEGVVVNPADASLGKFFRVIGGNLMIEELSIPTENGLLSLQNGSSCPSGEQGTLQVFLYKTQSDGMFYQQKLQNPANYIISPFGQIPPGDCIIVEFGTLRDKTDKLCRSYKVAETLGKLKGEVFYGN